MYGFRLLALSGALCLGLSAAVAQPAGNTTTGAPPTGMGPHMGQGMGPGPHMGGGGMRGGPGTTMGWSLMTPEERREHQAKMMSMKSGKECRAYVEQHHRQMAERAKQRGGSMPPAPMHDPCAGLPD